MEYRTLGRSGLKVSALAMGAMTFGGQDDIFRRFGSTDVAGARRQVDLCLDAGVNLIDTANVYSFGLSEEIVGRAVEGRRDRVLLSTKARVGFGGPNAEGLSRHHLLAEVEASLRRLGTDHIDVFHVHGWDGQTPLEETMGTLDGLVRSGKVRYLGVSNFAGWQLMKALATSDARGYERFVSNQVYYSLECRDAEYELLPASIDQGLGIIAFSPLARGLLTGKHRRGRVSEETLAAWPELAVRDPAKLLDTIETVVAIADGHAATPAQVALAYLLAKPGVASLILGARSDDQLTENLGAIHLALTPDDLAALDRVSAPELVYPHWHQHRLAAARFSDADQALHRPAR
ncbi:aryl-alcohol dehydrogenase-like predicted oxidoreductase [Actinocorallia herbida]|uniref:Aryl-alcohol dehydrogenase-like predicted oxidoreductase n=1 Tax=Actinocorallia herbida TaxID=58109 RepID=A0A3N1CYD6_9ACTN|nr:aldo/keto reductase [Actinocorallia herbida]ROO86291.1 aryl-alcohol dehydrogenase-like predicted oxidoreductase [Actinocorallia herbida]